MLLAPRSSIHVVSHICLILDYEYGNISLLQSNIDEAANTINARLIHVVCCYFVVCLILAYESI